MYIDFQHIWPILQHKVCTSSDNDAGLFVCQHLDNLRLIVKEIFLRNKVFASWRNQFIGINASGWLEENRTFELLIRFCKELFIDAAIVRSHSQNLHIIAWDSQMVCQHLSNRLSAASIFPGNRNYIVIHAIPSFHVITLKR